MICKRRRGNEHSFMAREIWQKKANLATQLVTRQFFFSSLAGLQIEASGSYQVRVRAESGLEKASQYIVLFCSYNIYEYEYHVIVYGPPPLHSWGTQPCIEVCCVIYNLQLSATQCLFWLLEIYTSRTGRR